METLTPEKLEIANNLVEGRKLYGTTEDVIYAFSTFLYDLSCGSGKEKNEWLVRVKNEMGIEFYLAVLEGYVYGNHDT